jgi:hypothetical protein
MLRSNGPSVHPVLLSSQLQLSNSSDATRMWGVGSSNGANSAGLLHSVPSTPTLALGCHRFIRRCHFLFSCVFDFGSTCHLLEPSYNCFITLKIDYLLNLACVIMALIVVTFMGPINAYKDMLDNMVSPIDHVVMNH